MIEELNDANRGEIKFGREYSRENVSLLCITDSRKVVLMGVNQNY